MTCTLGEIGGLLFLAIFVGALLFAVVALILGAIGARWFNDIQRAEAMRGINGRDDK